MITFENIEKEIDGHIILSNINLVIQPGEFVCLVGKSGVGKSTLFKILSGEILPTHGDVMVDGVSIPSMSSAKLQKFRRNMGFVHQDFLLLNKKTVYENIAFALEVSGYSGSQIRDRARTVLEMVGLTGKEKRYPHELSGGEKQRVAIARALIHKPKLLIADEPTGNLDPETTKDIFDLLLKINSIGTTVLVTTHNNAIVDSIQKRVVVIENGVITSDREKGKYK